MKKILLILSLGLLLISCCNDNISYMSKQTNNKYLEYRYDYYGNVLEVRENTNNYINESVLYNPNLIGTITQDTINIYYHTFGGNGSWEGKIRLIELKETTYINSN